MVLPFLIGGIALAGLGLQFAGMQDQKKAAQAQYAAQQKITRDEQEQERLRMRAMEFDARRRQLETVRQQQRFRANALATATNQGAGEGSGLQGAYGQFSGQTGTELQGIYDNLLLGRENSVINQRISQSKLEFAAAGGKLAEGAGLSSLGGALLNSAGTLGQLGTNLFGGLGGK